MASIFECPVCFETNENNIKCTLPCKHHLCLKCTLILTPSLCPLCRKDYTSAIDIIKSFCKKVRDDYNNTPRFKPSDFPPLS